MTAKQFRKIALSLPEAAENEHMGHPDFRVRGRIFATLAYPDDQWAMVKLTREQQEEFVRDEPDVFQPVKGGWGLKGATSVNLANASERDVRPALVTAWRNTVPKRLSEQFGDIS